MAGRSFFALAVLPAVLLRAHAELLHHAAPGELLTLSQPDNYQNINASSHYGIGGRRLQQNSYTPCPPNCPHMSPPPAHGGSLPSHSLPSHSDIGHGATPSPAPAPHHDYTPCPPNCPSQQTPTQAPASFGHSLPSLPSHPAPAPHPAAPGLPPKSVCYSDAQGTVRSNCNCHHTCKACGYDADPTGPEDCISCTDGLMLVPGDSDDGSGTCERDTVNYPDGPPCFAAYGEAPIADCVCDPSCASCGYGPKLWPEYPQNCLACMDGMTLHPIFADGTGICLPGGETYCYASSGEAPLSGCRCDQTCESCGYGHNPTGPSNCLSCKPGLTLVANDQGVGTCTVPMCYEWEGAPPTEGCACDPSCMSCGYDVNPNGIHNCLTCANGLWHDTDKPATLHDDPVPGTGTCIPKPECYAEAGGAPILGCECHPNCGDCGYSDSPTGPDSCTRCNPPLYFNPITIGSHPTGMCLTSPPGLGIFSANVAYYASYAVSGVVAVAMLGVLVSMVMRRRRSSQLIADRAFSKPLASQLGEGYGTLSTPPLSARGEPTSPAGKRPAL